jgi:hypothetical protein
MSSRPASKEVDRPAKLMDVSKATYPMQSALGVDRLEENLLEVMDNTCISAHTLYDPGGWLAVSIARPAHR